MEFGAYAQVTREHSNEMNERAAGGICLGPTGNTQGTHYFISLATGKRIRGTEWIELPMPQEVVDRIDQLGKEQGFPKTLIFADRHGKEILDSLEEAEYWTDDDEDFIPTDGTTSDDDNDDWFDDYGELMDNYDEELDNDSTVPDQEDMSGGNSLDIMPNHGHGIDTDADTVGITGADNHNEEDIDNTGTSDTDEQEQAGKEELPNNDESSRPTGADDDEDPDANEGPTLQEEFDNAEEIGIENANNDAGLPVRPKRSTRDPSFLYNIFQSTPQEAFNYLMSQDYKEVYCFLTKQMTAKKGLKRFKEAGAKAIMDELEQIVYRRVMHGKHAHDLSREDKRAALRYLMFLKQKRCGKIKARGCADRRKQRLYKTKEETSSPTVSIEGMILTCMVDAYERRSEGHSCMPT